jgi:hypothetical protein
MLFKRKPRPAPEPPGQESALDLALASGLPLSAATANLLYNADKGGAWEDAPPDITDRPEAD